MIQTGCIKPCKTWKGRRKKPGKAKGPPVKLQPIVMLSILWKLLAIRLLNHISDRLYDHIPLSQVPYRPGRGTIKHVLVLTMQLLAEKAIISCDYATHILIMDTSKAFDNVRRSGIINDLKSIPKRTSSI